MSRWQQQSSSSSNKDSSGMDTSSSNKGSSSSRKGRRRGKGELVDSLPLCAKCSLGPNLACCLPCLSAI